MTDTVSYPHTQIHRKGLLKNVQNTVQGHSVCSGDIEMAITEEIVARVNADLQRAQLAASRARQLLAEAEAEASDLAAFLRTLEKYATPIPNSEGIRRAMDHDKNTARTSATTVSRGTRMADVAIATIKEVGKPVPIGKLLDAVLAAGFTLGGADQKSNLAGYLSRDPRVESRGRNIGWDVVVMEKGPEGRDSNESDFSESSGGATDRTNLTSTDNFEALFE